MWKLLFPNPFNFGVEPLSFVLMIPDSAHVLHTLYGGALMDSSLTVQLVDAIKSLKEAEPQWYKEDWFISLASAVIGAIIAWLITVYTNNRQDKKDKEKAKQDLIQQLIVIRANTESMEVYYKDCANTYLMSFNTLRNTYNEGQHLAEQSFNLAKMEYGKAQADFLKQCSLFTGLIDDDAELKALMEKCKLYVLNPESPAARVGIEVSLIDRIVRPVIALMEKKIDDERK